MLEKLDSLILAGCTRLSHWLQRNTGLTNYFIARMGVAFTATHVVLTLVNYFVQFLSSKSEITHLVVDAIVLLAAIHKSLACGQAEDALWSGSKTKPASLMIYSMKGSGYRLFWVGILLLDILELDRLHHPGYVALEAIYKVSFAFGLAVFYYFVAVKPLPPGKSKIQEWVDGLQMMRQPATANSTRE